MEACFRDEGYTVEWRVVNADEYGYQQRRRRTFIFAYKNDTNYAKEMTKAIDFIDQYGDEFHRSSIAKQIFTEGFFAKAFPVIFMERLLWVKDFIRKDTFAPFSCNRDEDYYSILSEKYAC